MTPLTAFLYVWAVIVGAPSVANGDTLGIAVSAAASIGALLLEGLARGANERP